MNIAYSKHTLANGLDVLIHEDRSCPIVSVNICERNGGLRVARDRHLRGKTLGRRHDRDCRWRTGL